MSTPTVRVCDFVLTDAVIPELKAARSEDVIAELVHAASACLGLGDEVSMIIAREVLAREQQGTSAIGRGIAVPHLKHRSIQRIAFALGRSTKGVSFAALDRTLVHVFALALAPVPCPPEYPAVLGKMLGLLQDRHVRIQLLSARTCTEMLAVLRDAESGQPH